MRAALLLAQLGGLQATCVGTLAGAAALNTVNVAMGAVATGRPARLV